MASSWDRVGQAASVMQVTGVDAFGLVSMIVQAAHTARRNRDLCQQLAQHVLLVADLLRKLDIPALRQHQETRRPLEQLDAALFRAYKLVRSCAQQQQNTSQLYQMFTGADVASRLRQAQEEIDRYINLIPMITLVAAVGSRQEATNDEVHEHGSNDAAPTQSRLPENRFSLQHVTQSLTVEELQPQGSSIDMEARRSGREARRNAWQVVVNNGMFDQMGRYLTYGGTHESTGTLVLPEGPLTMFSYKELCEATRGFSQVEKLGESFYRGFLQDQRLQVAIKRVYLDSSSMEVVKSIREKIIAEKISILSQLRHRSIVQLIGWCHEADELLLVSELLTNTCLGNHLHSSGYILTWPTRYKIILDIGDALLYMQMLGPVPVVHGNINLRNVMLDSFFNAKLGDFGRIDTGNALLGTRGYIAKELCESSYPPRFTVESDVYSFGVLILEIASGWRPVTIGAEGDGGSCFHLVRWVWELYGRGALLEAADPGLHGEFDADQMERALVVGLWCVHDDYWDRPSMLEATTALCDLHVPPPQLELPSEIAAAGREVTTIPDDESVH